MITDNNCISTYDKTMNTFIKKDILTVYSTKNDKKSHGHNEYHVIKSQRKDAATRERFAAVYSMVPF